MLEHIVDTVLRSSVEDTFVVLGYLAGEISALIKDRPVRLVTNEEWTRGQGSSISAGLRALPDEYEACLFLLGDQPNVTTGLIDTVLTRYRRTLRTIVVPSYRGRRGNPVLFGRSLFPRLLTLRGDRGGRDIILRHQDPLEIVEVEDENAFLDIDTVDDYQEAGP